MKPKLSYGNAGPGDDGFTTIEVLVAFVIITLAAGSLFQIFSQGARSIRVSAEHAHAVLLAKSVLAKAMHIQQVQGNGDRVSGSSGPYSWTVKRTPHRKLHSAIWIAVIVRWPNSKSSVRQKELSVQTLHLK